jgi:hypothetical protein
VNEQKPETEDILEANKGRARVAALKAHSVVIRLKEMGLPEELDGELAALSTDLGDLWSAQEALAERMERFVSSSGGWESVGDSLVDLRATIDHMAWHLNSVRRPMNRITSYAYRQLADELGP